MSEQKSADVVQKQRREKRVQVLKRLIILSLTATVLIPYLLCVILFIRLNRMEAQLQSISGVYGTDNQVRETALIESKPDDETALWDGTPEKETEEGNEERSDETKPDHAVSENTVKVYLTFDDGPSNNTDAILDILKEQDVKATFFVVGKPEEMYGPMYRRIVEEGHTIGMHSYSHKYDEVYKSAESFREDLHRIRELIYDRTGVVSYLYRFPGGSSNTVSHIDMNELISLLNQEKITYFDWNVSSLDATGVKLSADDIVKNVTDKIQSYHTAVVLMHDTNDKTTTVEALPKMIETLRSMENVELLPITDDTVKVQHTVSGNALP